MIKYGVGGRELGKPDETEIVMTHRGIVKRKKAEKEHSTKACEIAERLAKERSKRPDKEILTQYAGRSDENFVSQDEANWKKIFNNGGIKR